MPKQLRFTNYLGNFVRNFPYEFQSASIFARRLDTAKKLSNLYTVYQINLININCGEVSFLVSRGRAVFSFRGFLDINKVQSTWPVAHSVGFGFLFH